MLKYRVLKFNLIFLLFVVLVFSCGKNTETEIIDKEEFVNIVTDLQIAEGIMANKGWSDASLGDSTKSYYNFVLKKYNVSRDRFDFSMKYYSKNLDNLTNIFDQVLTNIKDKVPGKFNPNSIYILNTKSLEEAKMKVNPVLRYGVSGIELWSQKNFFSFPFDTSRFSLNLNKEIKYPCLIVLKADYMLMPKNKTKNIRMNLIVQYQDSTADTLEKQIKIQNGKWEQYYLVLKTDSLKKPIKINSSVFKVDSIYNKTFVNIRSISLKQYAPGKDTTNMFIKPKQLPIIRPMPNLKKFNKKDLKTNNFK